MFKQHGKHIHLAYISLTWKNEATKYIIENQIIKFSIKLQLKIIFPKHQFTAQCLSIGLKINNVMKFE